MALALNNAPIVITTTARTQVYAAATGVTATIFDGTIANVDITKVTHYITVELEGPAGVFTTLGKDVAVPYGVAPRLPKIVVKPTQKLHVTADAANAIHVNLSVAEKS